MQADDRPDSSRGICQYRMIRKCVYLPSQQSPEAIDSQNELWWLLFVKCVDLSCCGGGIEQKKPAQAICQLGNSTESLSVSLLKGYQSL